MEFWNYVIIGGIVVIAAVVIYFKERSDRGKDVGQR